MRLKVGVSRRAHRRGLFLIFLLGLSLFVWQLGSTGLVDETPPLFAAAGRSMGSTGDWLTPRVNGLPRFDKPPLIYWLMSLGYSTPFNELWDPLGTWAARLPSALASLFMMLVLGDTLMVYPQKDDLYPRRTAIATSLAFALSPLVLIWSRIAVSDALLCSTFGVSLLLLWRSYANPINSCWKIAWLVLGLAVLTKGPVAIVLMAITLTIFCFQQRNLALLFNRLHPIRGLLITSLVSLPWYLIELLVEGQEFWNSFFGYHNFQRFTSVVNSHQQPFWFFLLVFVIASLPFTPFLLIGLNKAYRPFLTLGRGLRQKPSESLVSFAGCWLVSVFLLFTFAATKLPSYWLPATPAAAVLIGISTSITKEQRRSFFFGWGGSVICAAILAVSCWISPHWILYISDPEMPSLSEDLIASNIVFRSAICFTISAFLGLFFLWRPRRGGLLIMQAPLVALNFLVLLPLSKLADQIRQLPLRQAAQLVVSSQKPLEPLAMVGAVKPSLHFYSNNVVLYEGRSSGALVNLAERLRYEKRDGWTGRPIEGEKGSSTVLVVIDQATKKRAHWKGLRLKTLGRFGIYYVLRIDRRELEERSKGLVENGVISDWRKVRPERF